MKTALIVFGIIFISAGAVGMLYPIGNFLLGLSAWIKQLKLNRHKISWIAMFLWIISILLMIILSFVIIIKLI